MLLPVFLVVVCVGLATSRHVNEIHSAEPTESAGFATDSHCACTKEPIPQCGCCFAFEYEEKQHKVCANITYVAGKKALQFTVTLDGKVLVNETLSAKNPPAFCQGPQPLAYICEKYSNMSYGDDNKWGGCLEIYGVLLDLRVLDVNFGCFYLPVDAKQVHKNVVEKPATLQPDMNGFMDYLKGVIVDGIQLWNGNNFGMKRSGRRQEKRKGNLMNILFKNHMDEEENEDIEIPDIN